MLRRINGALGKTEEDYYRAVSESFMVSADNAHAVHPNHPQKTDAENCVYMNEGIVIKSHAGQKYTSDAVSIAIFRNICKQAGVPVQFFANRSDEAGGSTLGNISSAQVSHMRNAWQAVEALHQPHSATPVQKKYFLMCFRLLHPNGSQKIVFI